MCVVLQMATVEEEHAGANLAGVPGNEMMRDDNKATDKAGTGEVSSGGSGQAFKIIIYGAVNVMMTIPCQYGYAAIIFRSVAATTNLSSSATPHHASILALELRDPVVLRYVPPQDYLVLHL